MSSFDPIKQAKKIREKLGADRKQWNDWRWQMRCRITKTETLSDLLPLKASEIEEIDRASERFRWALTPYSLSLIDPDNPNCPIRRQIVPSGMELSDPAGLPDPLEELQHSPVPDLIHLYPDRVALCITSICQAYCRHCFRKRRVHEKPPKNAFDRAVKYLAEHSEIRDVLVTGGDPMMFSDDRLMEKMERLRALPNVQILRIGTRSPSMLPMRITNDLVNRLRSLHPLYVNVQFNHPRELSPEAVTALGRLADAGIPLGNQSVLLRGVNDSLPIMRELVHRLLQARVRPYYIFHPQIVEGTGHLRVPLETGLDIHDGLEGFTSGLAVPLYILDTPYGKVPLSRSRILSRDDESFTVRSFGGKKWTEPNKKNHMIP